MNEKKEERFPTKFGLAGIGIALLMLGFSFIELITLNSAVLATVLTMGFAAPLLAGILEYVKGNSYRATSFILFSLLFLTFYIFSTRALGGIAAENNTRGIFYLAWTLVTIVLLCGTFFKKMEEKMIMLQIILTTFLLFTLLLAIAQFTQINAIFIVAGVLALICAVAIFVDFAMHICKRMRKDAPATFNK